MLRKRAQSPELTIQDIAEAERLWILDCQSTLVKDKNFPMWETQFNLFKDDSQIIRCGGRLQNANLPFSSKHPILLNKKHYLTYLIVKNAHRRVQHNSGGSRGGHMGHVPPLPFLNSLSQSYNLDSKLVSQLTI